MAALSETSSQCTPGNFDAGVTESCRVEGALQNRSCTLQGFDMLCTQHASLAVHELGDWIEKAV